MATFLTLTNLVLARLNETQLTSATFAAAAGPQLVMANAINAAVADISRRYTEWPFNYGKQTFTTTAGTQEYTPPSTVTSIKWSTFGIQQNNAVTPAIQAKTLVELDYNLWTVQQRAIDQQAQSTNWSIPNSVIKGDDGNIILSGPPGTNSDTAHTNYTIYYDAWSNPAAMVNYNDVCTIPDIYNYILTDGAIYYGYDFRSDTQSQDRAKSKFDAGVAEMQRQLIKPTNAFQSTQIVNQRTYNSIPSRYGL